MATCPVLWPNAYHFLILFYAIQIESEKLMNNSTISVNKIQAKKWHIQKVKSFNNLMF